jgi:phage terminase large subunit-like protein
VAGAAKGGILKVIDGGWVPAFLSEAESFPRSTYKDQIDSLSGAFNRLSRGGFAMSVA